MSAASAPSPIHTALADAACPAAYNRELWLRARQYIRVRDLNIAEFASEVEYSRTVLSQYLGGKYDNPAGPETAITAFFTRLERHAETAEHYAATAVSQMVIEACREAFEDRKIVAIHGQPEMGKSTGLRRFLALDRERTPYVMFTAFINISRTDVVREVASQLGISHSGAVGKTQQRIVSALRKRPHVIVVDDASFLRLPGLETLRFFQDQAQCGLVLVGTTALMLRLLDSPGRIEEELAQFRSRIGRRVDIDAEIKRSGGFPREHLAAVARAHAPDIEAKVIDALCKRGRRPRALVNILTQLARLRRLNPEVAVMELIPVAEQQIFEA